MFLPQVGLESLSPTLFGVGLEKNSMGRDTREMRWGFQWGGQHLDTAKPSLTAGSYGILLTQLTSYCPERSFRELYLSHHQTVRGMISSALWNLLNCKLK